MFRTIAILILWIVLSILTSGCDDRTTQIAREAADRQAQQNNAMSELTKEIATGSHELVEADAQARQEIVGVHRDLQAERTRLDTGWNALETERQRIAGQRRIESMLGSLATLVGGLLLVVVLLGFCWYAIGAAHSDEDLHFRLNDYLVSEVLAADLPRLSADRCSRPLSSPPDPPDRTH
jgi:hypothetical protein